MGCCGDATAPEFGVLRNQVGSDVTILAILTTNTDHIKEGTAVRMGRIKSFYTIHPESRC